jgi:hypothetical protein
MMAGDGVLEKAWSVRGALAELGTPALLVVRSVFVSWRASAKDEPQDLFLLPAVPVSIYCIH